MDQLNSDKIKSNCLRGCASDFRWNMMRTATFGYLPNEVAFLTAQWQAFEMSAIQKVSGKTVSFRELGFIQLTPEILKQIKAEIEEYEDLPDEDKNLHRLAIGLSNVEQLAENNIGMQRSLEALMTSIILESWLFFEALCSDLWVSAVDNGTKEISNRIGSFGGWNNPDENIKPQDAGNLEFDARTNFGSFLREIGKVAFTKLRDIKRFYTAAFGESVAKVFDQASGGWIHALAATRNCILHSGGMVDGHFKRAVERFPELRALNIRQEIPLDGELVTKLRDASAETGLALIQHVDAMLHGGSRPGGCEDCRSGGDNQKV